RQAIRLASVLIVGSFGCQLALTAEARFQIRLGPVWQFRVDGRQSVSYWLINSVSCGGIQFNPVAG
ncbi:MAG: hypothetical protein ACLP7O_17155, partial [Terracidiphilus sp.]